MEERLVDLEIRYTHQAELVRELSDVIFAQRRELERLEGRVKELEQRLLGGGETPNEKPPHY